MHYRLLHPERYEEIRSAVADLIEDWGIQRYPFSIWSLLCKMGIKAIPYSAIPENKRENLVLGLA
jgi:hypothetical protein